MIKNIFSTAILAFGFTAQAHFQIIKPDVIITEGKAINIDLIFTHPMALEHTMEMGIPQGFSVLTKGIKTDLIDSIEASKFNGKTIYKTKYRPKSPGDLVFSLTPAPFYEKAEEMYIQQHSKVVVNAFGECVGWGAETGTDVEIVPLVRPYGLWTGMIFRAKVLVKGQPLKNAEVEVEYWNEGGTTQTPGDIYDNQVIVTDDNGIFTFALPKAGWWGFAALDCVEGSTHKGKKLSVDGVMFVKCMDVK